MTNGTIIISCGAKKLSVPAIAERLYIGSFFRGQLLYALSNAPRANIRILSAKYGLVELDQTILPYEATIKRPTKEFVDLVRLQANGLPRPIHFVCGSAYAKVIKHIEPGAVDLLQRLPRKGLGHRLAWMKQNRGTL